MAGVYVSVARQTDVFLKFSRFSRKLAERTIEEGEASSSRAGQDRTEQKEVGCQKRVQAEHEKQTDRQDKMAKAKARTTIVQLVSTAKTGYRRTLLVPRTAREITQVRYDPVVQRHVLFVESKKRKGEQPKPLDFSRGAFLWKKK